MEEGFFFCSVSVKNSPASALSLKEFQELSKKLSNLNKKNDANNVFLCWNTRLIFQLFPVSCVIFHFSEWADGPDVTVCVWPLPFHLPPINPH